MPHTIAIDHAGPCFLGNSNHAAVYVCRNADDEARRWMRTKSIQRPALFDHVNVGTNAPASDEDAATVQFEGINTLPTARDPTRSVRRLQHLTSDANSRTGALIDNDPIDLVSELELNQSSLCRSSDWLLECLQNCGTRAPC